jgi:hypothetical protein
MGALGKVCETVLQVFVYDMGLKKYADQAIQYASIA